MLPRINISAAMKPQSHINDLNIRLLFIPFFGIAIPNLTGLFGHVTFRSPLYWIGYGYFILISFVIWHGNRYLLFKQREHYDWFQNPIRKLTTLVFANVFYTAPVTALMLLFWYYFAGFAGPDWNVIKLVTLMNVIAVIFITHVYETVFLIKERESDLLQFEKLERAKAQAELAALKSQIDPHFMFNSLNTLSYLIENDREKALRFNEHLSDVYRYILMNKDRELVQLREEIEFLNHYFSLLQLRFGKGVQLTINGNGEWDDYLIPPISLQILLENAVKHNQVDESSPLGIRVRIGDSCIVVSNPRRPRLAENGSPKTGLKTLNERYKLITGREISIQTETDEYSVTLPILRTTS